LPTQIIGGELAGRRIKTPAGAGVRPTTALVRRGLFDSLGARVLGTTVLDLFAGAGTLGLEALSRGAARATFVDHNLACVKIVQENLRLLRLTERSAVVRADAGAWLKEHVQDLPDFGLILLDPPYRYLGLDDLMRWLGASVPWPAHSLLVVEHHRRRPLPAVDDGLALERTRDYGDARLSFFQGSG